ncbi:MAG: beta-lactamase family protein [Blastocatellia bacterium]|nr:beta-lactamase family protein [Blastocatellia bacterium]
MSKRLLSLLLILILSNALAFAQTKPAAQANPHAALTVEAKRLARLDSALQEYVDKNQLAGIVAFVLQDGKPVYERAFGWADKESNRKMTTDTIFRIASQTKAITSAAILMLLEDGKLNLDDPVWRFIPTFRNTKVAVKKDSGVEIVPAKRAITIRDLLTHTAGISYGTSPEVAALYEAKGLGPAAGMGWYTADKDEPVGVTMERLGTLPFVAQPGEAYVYGYNTDILGAVVEKAAGMPLDQFIRERITQPLGMKDTQFFLPLAEKNRLATVYSSKDGQAVRAVEGSKGQGHYVDGPRKSFAGGAGLLSTARDYARFLEMTRNGGTLDGVRVMSPRTVMLMRTNQAGTLHSQTGLGFGYGFQTTDRYGASGMDGVGAYGWSGAYGTSYRVDPESRLTMVLMIQQMPNGTDIQRKFSTLVYQALVH